MATLYTARLLFPGDAPPIAGGALLDMGGAIAAVGPLTELIRQYSNAEVVDYGDALLLPLLVNAHTHLELTDFCQWAEAADETAVPNDFVDWILKLIRVKRTLNKKHYVNSVANGISQSIAAGTGAVGDIVSQYSSRKAYQGSALHGTLFLETLGLDPTVTCRLKNDLNDVLEGAQAGQMQFGLSPHAPYSISVAYLSDIYRKCQNEKLLCMTHIAESQAEVEFLVASRGPLAERLYPKVGWEFLVPKAASCRSIEFLQKNSGLFSGNILVHGVQLTTEEIELLAANGSSLVLCPRSNDCLKVGKAPVARLLSSGVKLALGTDSLASNESLSIWDEMAFAHSWFNGQLDAPTLFRMATVGGAEMLGLHQQLGSLTVGKQSSFQVLEPEAPLAADQVLDYCVAPGRSADIAQVVMQGRAQLSGLH